MSGDQETKSVEGAVTAFYPSEGENDPYNVYVDTEDGKFSTFNGETVEDIEEGVRVRFEAEQNNGHWNIVDGSVEIIEQDEEPEVYGDTEPDTTMSPTDARIGSQSVLRSAVLHHQHREDSTDEDVVETAKRFADAQLSLYEKLRNAGQGEAQ